jgi:hypothetical protein
VDLHFASGRLVRTSRSPSLLNGTDVGQRQRGQAVTEKEKYKRRRAELRVRFGSLYDFLLALLFEVDPAGINFETNTDEYEPEVDTILSTSRERPDGAAPVAELFRQYLARANNLADHHRPGPARLAQEMLDDLKTRGA